MDCWDHVLVNRIWITNSSADNLPPATSVCWHGLNKYNLNVWRCILDYVRDNSCWRMGSRGFNDRSAFRLYGAVSDGPVVYSISADWGDLALFFVLTALMMAGGAGGVKAYEASQVTGRLKAT
jgi:hypothetical protein